MWLHKLVPGIMNIGSHPASLSSPSPCTQPVGDSESEASHAETIQTKDLKMGVDSLEKHTISILADFLEGLSSVDDIRMDLQKNYSEESIPGFVQKALATCLDKQPPAQNKTGILLANLIDYDIIPVSVFIEQLASIYDVMDEIAVNVPNVWELQAQIVVPVINANKVHFGNLKEMAKRTNSIPKIIVPILQVFLINKCKEFKGKFWNLPIKMIDEFMACEDSDVDAFIEEHEFLKNVRAILNKLTAEKFETLVQKFLALPINSEKRLSSVVQLILEKAVFDEHDVNCFTTEYAKLGERISSLEVPKGVDDVKEKTERLEEKVSLRMILIDMCQQSNDCDNKAEELTIANLLEKINNCNDPKEVKQMKYALEEMVRSKRIKRVGIVRFCGELFKHGMLTSAVMCRIIELLLDTPDDESLECLCKLLSTIGKDLECQKTSECNSYFNQMEDLSQKNEESKICRRVLFMLRDAIDLKNSKWVPRVITIECPKWSVNKERAKTTMRRLNKLVPGEKNNKQDRSKQDKETGAQATMEGKPKRKRKWYWPKKKDDKQVPMKQNKEPKMQAMMGEEARRSQYQDLASKHEVRTQEIPGPVEYYGCREVKYVDVSYPKTQHTSRNSSANDAGGNGGNNKRRRGGRKHLGECDEKRMQQKMAQNQQDKSEDNKIYQGGEPLNLGKVEGSDQQLPSPEKPVMDLMSDEELDIQSFSNNLNEYFNNLSIEGEGAPQKINDVLNMNINFVKGQEDGDFKESIEDCSSEFFINAAAICNLPSMKEVYKNMLSLMQTDQPYENIIQYIMSAVGNKVEDPQFIHTLIMTICEACINGKIGSNANLNLVKFKQYEKLLMRFVDSNQDREVFTLDSVNGLTCKNFLPQGLINSIFGVLLDDGIVSSESFVKWKRIVERW